MRYRIYTVRLPQTALGLFNIPVELPGGPGVQPLDADGFYVEWRNRPLRCPNKLSLGAAQFVPRFRLGFTFSIALASNPFGAPTVPTALFSYSLVGPVFTTTAGATTNGDGGLADSGGAPIIQLDNIAATAGRIFRLYLGVCEARDEDRDNTGA